MGFQRINLKQCLVLGGVVLLMTAIGKEKLPLASTSRNGFTSPQLTYARMNLPPPATNSAFLDHINLSLDPPAEVSTADLNDAGLNFPSDLPVGRLAEWQSRPGNATKHALSVADRKLNYELFGSEDFAFKLNLTPTYPRPEAMMPTGLGPGFGISLKF